MAAEADSGRKRRSCRDPSGTAPEHRSGSGTPLPEAQWHRDVLVEVRTSVRRLPLVCPGRSASDGGEVGDGPGMFRGARERRLDLRTRTIPCPAFLPGQSNGSGDHE
jgi:hypothetical protein